eukprot:gnl/Hemi2/24901_TR8375_c0_g1_i1.p1 gnl/Hemi2/24901_TR8375_c0_g1~~gnl/Hemi2/24901_TR8375_c0_g1_i1.p1  ORF type:complete len:224 (-),score=74.55 gnl/Hemi2/24901_TR8375_c0_g1_i1:88-699(-)
MSAKFQSAIKNYKENYLELESHKNFVQRLITSRCPSEDEVEKEEGLKNQKRAAFQELKQKNANLLKEMERTIGQVVDTREQMALVEIQERRRKAAEAKTKQNLEGEHWYSSVDHTLCLMAGVKLLSCNEDILTIAIDNHGTDMILSVGYSVADARVRSAQLHTTLDIKIDDVVQCAVEDNASLRLLVHNVQARIHKHWAARHK